MTKRIISILLSLVMLIGLLPMSALAEGIHIEKLTSLKVYVDEPVAGREADFSAVVRALPTNAARVYVEQYEYSNYYHGVGWRDITDERYLEEGECFIAGHEYAVRVYVIVNNYFYELSPTLGVSVNGETATSNNGTSTTKTIVHYNFGVCKNPPPDITSVTVGGNLRPVAGQSPVYSLAFDNERMEADAYAGTAFKNGVAWYNSNTYVILDENDVFQAGQTYTMLVQLKAKGNYRFATENGESVVKATVEGVEAINISAQESEQDRYLKLQVEFTCAQTDTLGGGCDALSIRIPYPVGGKKMSFEPTLYGENCEYVYENKNGFYDGVKWTNRTNNYTYNNNSVFTEGTDYSVTVLVKAKSALQDETRLRYLLHGDGTVDPYIRATVNGLPARVEPYGDQNPAQVVQVTFDFPACNSTARTIDDIAFTDIRTPVVGNKVDTVATVEYGYKENIPTTKKTMDLTWARIDENGSESRELTEDDVFEEGYLYAWMVVLSTDSLSDFAVVDNQLVVNLSVRGAVHTVIQPVSSKQIIVAAFYMPYDSLPDPINRIDIIGALAPTVGQRPYYDASLKETLMPYAAITDVTWLENGNTMAENATFKKGNSYGVIYTVETVEPYTFAQTAVIRASVNGNETRYNGYDGSTGLNINVSDDGRTASIMWVYGELGNASYSGVTDYVEIGELMRPAPGQTPDFNVDISSAYTQFGGVNWYELDENGYIVAPLAYNDCFKSNTAYRVEIRVLPTAGRSINLDSRGAVFNGEYTNQYYYLSEEAVVVYAEYDTAFCITELDIIDVQYPIPGKTPDTDVCTDNSFSAAEYENGSKIDWYYETNPGTAAAGFSRLDGKFKSDRRHQAYVELQTNDGYWFATDKDGDLAVDAYMDGVPVDFAYTTDSYLDDGAVNKLETARTYELAKNVSGVFVDGMWLTDGQYLDSAHWGIQTEDTVDKEAGYAYYNDGVLTLHNFEWRTHGDYNILDSYKPLTIKVEGNSELESLSNGIVTNNTLTLDGDGALKLTSNGEGIFAMGDVTVENGTWVVEDNKYDGLWLYSGLTVNGGTLDVYGPQCGINGDDYPPVNLNGGTLIARAKIDCAIGWCDTQIASGAAVTVGDASDGVGAVSWDNTTDFIDYAYVCVAFEADTPSILKGDADGDGIVTAFDALLTLQHANGASELTGDALTAVDVDNDGVPTAFDALKILQFANGAIDSF